MNVLQLCFLLCFSLSGWAEHFSRYEVINLVANEAGYGARTIDPRLINPWGLTFSARGNLIVADNDSNYSSVLATAYSPEGAILPFVIPDGTIHAYEPDTGDFLGTLLNANGTPITIEGLWSLKFEFDEEEECAELYFTAGPEDETDGLLGVIFPQFGSHVEQDPTEIRL